MSRYDYEVSKRIAAEDPPFYALIMAAMRKADTENLAALRRNWSAVWAELQERYETPGGYLASETRELDDLTPEARAECLANLEGREPDPWPEGHPMNAEVQAMRQRRSGWRGGA